MPEPSLASVMIDRQVIAFHVDDKNDGTERVTRLSKMPLPRPSFLPVCLLHTKLTCPECEDARISQSKEADGEIPSAVFSPVFPSVQESRPSLLKCMLCASSAAEDKEPEAQIGVGDAVEDLIKHANRWRIVAADDLENEIGRWRDCLVGCSLTPITRSLRLCQLGFLCHRRYLALGVLADLHSSVELHQSAVDMYTQQDQLLALLLHELARSLHSRFNHIGSRSDLETSISIYSRSLGSWTDERPSLGLTSILTSYGDALIRRYMLISSSEDMEQALSVLRRAKAAGPTLSSTSPPSTSSTRYDPTHGDALTAYAHALYRGYSASQDDADLINAASDLNKAIAFYPPHDQCRWRCLLTLGVVQWSSFYQWGRISDMEEAIVHVRQALEEQPRGHPLRHETMSIVAGRLIGRYNTRYGSPEDAAEGIELARQSLALHPPENPHKVAKLCALGGALLTYYRQSGKLEHVNESVDTLQQALDCTEAARRYVEVLNLCEALEDRFRLLQRQPDLKYATRLAKEAIALCPPGHPDRSAVIGRLVRIIMLSPKCQKADIDEAIVLAHGILRDRPPGHPHRSPSQINLSQLYYTRWAQFHGKADLKLCMQACRDAVDDTCAPLVTRFSSALNWIQLARNARADDAALEAYRLAIGLLPRVSYGGHDLGSLLKALESSGPLPGDACACALSLGRATDAVRLLEQGRALFWSRALNLRSIFECRELPPSLSYSLREVADALEAERNREKKPRDASGEKRVIALRRLNDRFEKLAAEARTYPGPANLLISPPWEGVAQAARHGVVVLLTASEAYGSWAIVLRNTTMSPEAIKLPNMSVERIRRFAKALEAGTRRARKAKRSERLGSNVFEDVSTWTMEDGRILHEGADDDAAAVGPQAQMVSTKIELTQNGTARLGLKRVHRALWHVNAPSVEVLLRSLWAEVAETVVKHLSLQKCSNPTKRPRLWWCPGGPWAALPVHAAGIYTEPTPVCMSDFVVSSYAPTLGSLVSARAEVVPSDSDPKFLFVAQPDAHGEPPLPNTLAELAAVREVLRSAGLNDSSTEFLSRATAEDILPKLAAASIVHLACHGHQNREEPLSSGFSMHDKNLPLSDIIRLKMPHALFAFLSACESAAGDRKLPDESLHLAAAMMFVGFKSVVATMWSMDDEDGQKCAKGIYGELFKQYPQSLQLDRIPYALDASVRNLRDSGVPASRWATYIHVGV